MDWKAAAIGGLALGAAIALWQVVSAAAFPGSVAFVPVAVSIQFLVTFLLLRSTADRQGYGAQVATGAVAGVIGAALIGCTSLLVSTVLFPGLGEQIGVTPAEGAIAGAFGAVSTGLVVSGGLALILRRQ